MFESQKLPTVAQIEASRKLYMHEKMEYWRLQDKILTELKDEHPGLADQQLTFIKATLVNSFYNARYSDIEKVTSWIVAQEPKLPEVYRNTVSNDDVKRIDLVRSIALRGRTKGTNEIDGYVFASKFAHFFLDAEAFPIYDQYARLVVHIHIDDLNEDEKPNSSYGRSYKRFFQFYKKFFRLKHQLEQRDGISYSTKTLDHYLWSAGQYIAWKKGIRRKSYINERISFDDPDDIPLFEMLFPQAIIEDILDDLLLSELDWENKEQKETWKKGKDEKSNRT